MAEAVAFAIVGPVVIIAAVGALGTGVATVGRVTMDRSVSAAVASNGYREAGLSDKVCTELKKYRASCASLDVSVAQAFGELDVVEAKYGVDLPVLGHVVVSSKASVRR